MKEDIDHGRFIGWPFHSEQRREDGEINNGAFDLTSYPEKIDAIHEATDDNGLRPLIKFLNRPEGCFMTLSCSYGQLDDELLYSYLEFTLRHPGLATRTSWPDDLEQKWSQYLVRADAQIPGIAPALAGSLKMAWRKFHLRPETAQRLLVTLYLRVASESDHKAVASHVQRFFELLESGELN